MFRQRLKKLYNLSDNIDSSPDKRRTRLLSIQVFQPLKLTGFWELFVVFKTLITETILFAEDLAATCPPAITVVAHPVE